LETLTLRKASIKDHSALLALEQKVIEAERPFNSTIRPEGAIYYDLEQLLTNEDSHVAVAEREGHIIATGYAQIRASKQSLKHERHTFMGFMYVSPEYRGLGINRQIITSLIGWSKEQGVQDFYLDVYIGNEAAINAYEKVGFVKSIIEMKINL
jgi:ribosomal protein S18 acetylase RimI-like enzyme